MRINTRDIGQACFFVVMLSTSYQFANAEEIDNKTDIGSTTIEAEAPLDYKDFKPVPMPAERKQSLFADMYDLLTGALKQPELHKKINNLQKDQPTLGEAHFLRVSALKSNPEDERDRKEAMNAFASGTGYALATELSKHNEFLRSLSEGFKFDFDFGKPFRAKKHPVIRYRLISKKVSSESKDTKPELELVPEKKEEKTAAKTEESSYQLPSPRFNGKLIPQSKLSETDGNQVPGLTLSLQQNEDFYHVDIPISNLDGAGPTHTFRIPIVGTASFTRQCADDGTPISSSFNNMLVLDDAPTLNMSYQHIEMSYASKLIIKGADYDLIFAGTMPRDPPDVGRKGRMYPLNIVEYSMSYTVRL